MEPCFDGCTVFTLTAGSQTKVSHFHGLERNPKNKQILQIGRQTEFYLFLFGFLKEKKKCSLPCCGHSLFGFKKFNTVDGFWYFFSPLSNRFSMSIRCQRHLQAYISSLSYSFHTILTTSPLHGGSRLETGSENFHETEHSTPATV